MFILQKGTRLTPCIRFWQHGNNRGIKLQLGSGRNGKSAWPGRPWEHFTKTPAAQWREIARTVLQIYSKRKRLQRLRKTEGGFPLLNRPTLLPGSWLEGRVFFLGAWDHRSAMNCLCASPNACVRSVLDRWRKQISNFRTYLSNMYISMHEENLFSEGFQFKNKVGLSLTWAAGSTLGNIPAPNGSVNGHDVEFCSHRS